MFATLLALVVIAAPPSAAGRRRCGGQEVETNPNWGKSFAAAARFGPGYGRSHPIQAPPKLKLPGLQTKPTLATKFSVNIWGAAQPLPSRDLWLAAPVPLR